MRCDAFSQSADTSMTAEVRRKGAVVRRVSVEDRARAAIEAARPDAGRRKPASGNATCPAGAGAKCRHGGAPAKRPAPERRSAPLARGRRRRRDRHGRGLAAGLEDDMAGRQVVDATDAGALARRENAGGAVNLAGDNTGFRRHGVEDRARFHPSSNRSRSESRYHTCCRSWTDEWPTRNCTIIFCGQFGIGISYSAVTVTDCVNPSSQVVQSVAKSGQLCR